MYRKLSLTAVGLVLVVVSWFLISPLGRSPALSADEQYAWQQVDSSTASNLLDVDMLSANDGWAVGEASTFVHWNGGAWSPGNSTVQGNFYGVSMVSTTDGWAVGYGGKIARWDGASWDLFSTAPDEESLFDVDMIAADDGWIVGDNGTIFRWNGTKFTAVASPVDFRFLKVKMVSADEAWIVGFDFDNIRGVILRWDGAEWKEQTIPKAPRLFDIAMPSTTGAWAVGESGSVLEWAAGTWDWWDITWPLANTEIIWLMGIDMLSPDLGWMAGGYIDSTFIARWNGTTWTREPSPVDKFLQSIDMVSETDGWAVGYHGTILRYTLVETPTVTPTQTATPTHTPTSTPEATPTTSSTPAPTEWSFYVPAIFSPAKGPVWQSVSSPTGKSLRDVSMVSADDGWAVGDDSTFLRWNGSKWSKVNSAAKDDFFGVSMVSATDGWAVGANGIIARWDGSSWESFAVAPAGEWLWDVDAFAADDVWIVGDEGSIFHWTGDDWTFVSSPVDDQLFGVTMVSAAEGWIAGYDKDSTYGIILRWDGSEWTEQSIPPAPRLFGVAMPASTTTWAVGENGVILQRKNGTWDHWGSQIASNNVQGDIIWLNDVDMPSANSGWAVGGYKNDSTLVRWDGTKWSLASNPATEWLQGIDMVSEEEGWAVGYGGTIIHYAP